MNPDIESSFHTCIRNISLFMAQEAYAKAEQELDAFYETYSGKAEDTAWLNDAYYSWKALINEQQGNYETALHYYQQTDFRANTTEAQLHFASNIRILCCLNRHSEALIYLRELLSSGLHHFKSQGLPLLGLYADILENMPDYQPESDFLILAQDICTLLNIDAFESDFSSTTSCIQTIREMVTRNQKSNRAYTGFRRKYTAAGMSPEARKDLLTQYVDSEKIGFYRMQATQLPTSDPATT